MQSTLRCKKCTRQYAKSDEKYHTPLVSCYIRKGSGGKEWVKIEYFYCPDCGKIYGSSVVKENKKIQLKTGSTHQ